MKFSIWLYRKFKEMNKGYKKKIKKKK